MGYTTDFFGEFNLDKPLTDEHKSYLEKFSETRRMKRLADVVEGFDDPVREAVGLPAGEDGCYFVGGGGYAGQDDDDSLNHDTYNQPPAGQPGLWCQWIPSDDGEAIVWDGGEKFYDYVGWIQYLIDHFLEPWGYVVNGEVEWHGEEYDDIGKIVVQNNEVTTHLGHIVFEPEDS